MAPLLSSITWVMQWRSIQSCRNTGRRTATGCLYIVSVDHLLEKTNVLTKLSFPSVLAHYAVVSIRIGRELL